MFVMNMLIIFLGIWFEMIHTVGAYLKICCYYDLSFDILIETFFFFNNRYMKLKEELHLD